MARTKTTPAAGLRRCIGSARFGIAAHDAPVSDFPSQPSQKDGLGRMCKPDWAAYTRALRAAATGGKAGATLTTPKVQKAAAASTTVPAAKPVARGRRTAKEAKAAKPEPIRTKAPRKSKVAEVRADA